MLKRDEENYECIELYHNLVMYRIQLIVFLIVDHSSIAYWDTSKYEQVSYIHFKLLKGS